MTRTVKAVIVAVIMVCASFAYTEGYKIKAKYTDEVLCTFTEEDSKHVSVERVTAIIFESRLMRVVSRSGDIYILCLDECEPKSNPKEIDIVYKGNLTNNDGEMLENFHAEVYIKMSERIFINVFASDDEDYLQWSNGVDDKEIVKAHRGGF